jgi:hypothetical protein
MEDFLTELGFSHPFQEEYSGWIEASQDGLTMKC